MRVTIACLATSSGSPFALVRPAWNAWSRRPAYQAQGGATAAVRSVHAAVRSVHAKGTGFLGEQVAMCILWHKGVLPKRTKQPIDLCLHQTWSRKEEDLRPTCSWSGARIFHSPGLCLDWRNGKGGNHLLQTYRLSPCPQEEYNLLTHDGLDSLLPLICSAPFLTHVHSWHPLTPPPCHQKQWSLHRPCSMWESPVLNSDWQSCFIKLFLFLIFAYSAYFIFCIILFPLPCTCTLVYMHQECIILLLFFLTLMTGSCTVHFKRDARVYERVQPRLPEVSRCKSVLFRSPKGSQYQLVQVVSDIDLL